MLKQTRLASTKARSGQVLPNRLQLAAVRGRYQMTRARLDRYGDRYGLAHLENVRTFNWRSCGPWKY